MNKNLFQNHNTHALLLGLLTVTLLGAGFKLGVFDTVNPDEKRINDSRYGHRNQSTTNPLQEVLQAQNTAFIPEFIFNIDIPSIFHKSVTFLDDVIMTRNLTVEGTATFSNGINIADTDIDLGTGGLTASTVTASNIIYSLTAADGITIDGGQTPTVSNSGVLTLEGQTGNLTLKEGSGIDIEDLEFTNTDRGSSQSIFKNIAVSGQSTIETTDNDDTLTFVQGTGIDITTDKDAKKLLFAVNADAISQWTKNGTAIYYSSGNVGIGTTNPTATFHVSGTTTLAGQATITSGGLSLSGSGITNAGAITGATGLTSSGTVTFSGLTTGIVHAGFGGVLSSSALDLTSGASYLTGILPTTYGGTGLDSYTTGDLLFSSSANTLTTLGIGGEGEVLTVDGDGLPSWGSIGGSGGICSDCILSDPGSSQAITPSSQTATGLSVRQAASGTVDIFNVTSNDGTTKYLQVDKDGNVTLGGVTTQGIATIGGTNVHSLLISPSSASTTAYTGTLTSVDLTADRTWTLPDASGTFCLTTGNCNGVGGNFGGTGTTNYLAKFASGTTVENSSIYDNGNVGIGTTDPTSKLYVSGTQTVTGAAAFDATLSASGAATLGSTLQVSGAGSFLSTLDVTGATTLSSTLDVTGGTTIGGTLSVTGNGSIASSLTVGSDSYVPIGDAILELRKDSNSGAGLRIYRGGSQYIEITPRGAGEGTNNVIAAYGSGKSFIFKQMRDTNIGDFVFKNNKSLGSELLRIVGETGNVGIGTTTPGELLEVQGIGATLRVRNANDPGGTFIGQSWNTMQFGLYNPSGSNWGAVSAGAKRSFFGITHSGKIGSLTNNFGIPVFRNVLDDGTGNMGIGTTSPEGKLQIVSSENTPQLYLSDNIGNSIIKDASIVIPHYTASEEPVGLIIGRAANDATVVSIGGGGNVDNNAATHLEFFTAGNSTTIDGTLRMKIHDTGGISFGDTYASTDPGAGDIITDSNLGIGTTSPAEKLDLNGRLYLGDSTAPGTTTNRLYAVSGDLFWNGIELSGLTSSQWTTTGSDIYYNSGNVGIGTTAPETLLNLPASGDIRVGTQTSGQNEISISNTSIVNTYNITDSRFGLFSNGSTQLGLPSGYDAGALRLGIGGSYSVISGKGSGLSELAFFTGNNLTTPRMFINAVGNVGIGTTSPTMRLDVDSGGIRVQSNSSEYAFRQYRNDGPNLFNIDDEGRLDGGTRGYIQVNDNLQISGANRYINGPGVAISGTGNNGNIANGAYTNGSWNRLFNNILPNINLNSSTSKGSVGIEFTDASTGTPNFVEKISFNSNGKAAQIINAGTDQDIFTASSSGTTRFVIANDGNVGIGDATPSYPLDVAGKIGINGTQMVYLPDQTDFTNSLIIGNGGQNLSHSSGQQGRSNTGVGIGTFEDITTGTENSAFSTDALIKNTSGSYNTGFGIATLRNNTTGSYNTAVGRSAGFGSSGMSVIGNALFGYNAGRNINTGADYNTLLGYQAGDNITTGARNIIIGYGTDAPSATGSDQLNIGDTIYGNLSTGNIGIGTTSPADKLDILGSAILRGDVDNDTSLTINRFGGAQIITLGESGDAGVATFGYSGLNGGRIFLNGGSSGQDPYIDMYDTSGTVTNRIHTGGNSYFNGGNVGIGTTAPTSRLSLASDGTIANLFTITDNGSDIFSVTQSQITANVPVQFQAAGDTSLAYDLNFTNPSASYIKSSAPLYMSAGEAFNSSDLTLRTYNTGNVIVDSQALSITGSATVSGQLSVDGNVGIGTTSPSFPLQVDTTGNGLIDNTAAAVLKESSAGSFVGLGFAKSQTTGLIGKIVAQHTGSGSKLHFLTTSSYATGINTNVMTLDYNGNVGIGTTNPQGPLHIYSTNGKNRIQSTGNTAYLDFYTGPSAGNNRNYRFATSYNTAGLFQILQSSTEGTEPTSPVLAINASGNVGIGTTSPNAKLTIKNNAANGFLDNYSEYQMLLYDSGTAAGSFGLGIKASTMVFNSGGGAFSFDQGGTNSRMVINTSGNVGIGDADPGSKLSIDSLGSSTGTALVIDANGDVWKDSSSRRYKENIETLDSDFDKILEARPVFYQFKDTGAQTIGYVAEEFDELGLTDLVIYDNENRPDGIRYDRLGIYLLEIAKEQQARIDALGNVSAGDNAILNPSVILNETKDLKDSSATPQNDKSVAQNDNEEILKRVQDDISMVQNDIEGVQNDVSLLTTKLNTLQNLSDQTASDAAFLKSILESPVLGASDSALLNSVILNSFQDPQQKNNEMLNQVQHDTTGATVSGNLMVLGRTTVTDLGVTGTLTSGLLSISGLDNNCHPNPSVDGEGSSQDSSSAKGETQNDTNTCSNARATINSIGDLYLQNAGTGGINILAGKVTIDTDGNIKTTGEITAKKVNIDTEDTESASLGSSTLPQGDTIISIDTTAVTENSKIFITATSPTGKQELFVSEKTSGQHFTVEIEEEFNDDISFDWWVIN